MFRNIFSQFFDYLVPSRIFNTLWNVLNLWKTANTKERGLLVLVFFPMLFCLGGLFLSLLSFVVFVLPSFVVKMIMWGALVLGFNFGGNYCYSRLTGHDTSSSFNNSNASANSGWRTWTWSSTSGANYNNNDNSYTDVSYTDDEPSSGQSDSTEGQTQEPIWKTMFRNRGNN